MHHVFHARIRFLFSVVSGIAIAPLIGPIDHAEAAWTVGTPIVSYFAGPDLTDASAQQIHIDCYIILSEGLSNL